MLLVEPATIDNRRVIIDNKLATFDNSPATFDNKPATIDNRSAIDHSIVKTLYRRRAMKGSYYDESLCTLAKGLVSRALSLAPGVPAGRRSVRRRRAGRAQ